MRSFMRIALVATTLVASLALAGCDSGDGSESSVAPARHYSDARHGLAVSLPPGWSLIHVPLTNVTEPDQILAASSTRFDPGAPRGNCSPARAVDELPPGAALVQVIEYHHVPTRNFDPQPERLTYADGEHGTYECSGPSWSFDLRQHRRKLQVHVWFDRAHVSQRARSGALELIDGLELSRP